MPDSSARIQTDLADWELPTHNRHLQEVNGLQGALDGGGGAQGPEDTDKQLVVLEGHDAVPSDLEVSGSVPRVSWRAATDIRRLPTDERLLERLAEAAAPGAVPVLVASAEWVMIGDEFWDKPPSVPLLVTRDQLLVGRKAGRFAPRIETKAWWCKDLILRGVKPVAGAEQFTALEMEHWIDGRVAIVFGTRGECDVVAKLVER